MNICFDGFKSGTVCLGDTMAQLHGSEWGLTHSGVGILLIIGAAITYYVFRSPV